LGGGEEKVETRERKKTPARRKDDIKGETGVEGGHIPRIMENIENDSGGGQI